MNILVFSDSHGNAYNMKKIISSDNNVNLVIHLGDFVKDALRIKEEFSRINVEFVSGNNDWFSCYPSEKLLFIGKRKVLITHGHSYNVKKDYLRLVLRGEETQADLVLFGHTHTADEFYEGGRLYLNPGSIGLPGGGGPPSYAKIEISESDLRANIVRCVDRR